MVLVPAFRDISLTPVSKLQPQELQVDKLVGIQTFATPVVIEKTFRGLDVAFGINQGTTCWDDSGGEGNTIECGSGPFQAIITPLNYE